MSFPRSAFSGFPFDRDDFDRESREPFRTQLDDLAKRHPELAEQLGSFPFRTGSSGDRARARRPSAEEEFRRFTGGAGRPFGSSSRFERFGFPFSRDPFDEDSQPQSQHQPQPQSEQVPQQQPEASHNIDQPPPPQQQQEEPVVKERGRKQPNIQQSNTVDLGQSQKDDSLDESRGQRSMSAPPPDNRTGQQRFVSSINIPINRQGGMGDSNMGAQQSQQQEQQSKPTERIIPIHVEGRDEPVISKSNGPTFTHQPPQTERIFGQRPSQFTKFVNKEPPRYFGAPPQQNYAQPQQAENLRQQQQDYQQQQQQKFQQQPKQPDREVPVQRQQPVSPQPQPQQEQPEPPPNKSGNNPIDIIQAIQKDVSELMGQVENFGGLPRDKQYLYIDEMLTRNLIKLDNIDTQGQENIRLARKEAVRCIEGCIGILEAKAAANVPKQEQKLEGDKMEVEVKTEEMEVEVKPENKDQDSKMEVENNTSQTVEAAVEKKEESPSTPAVVVEEQKDKIEEVETDKPKTDEIKQEDTQKSEEVQAEGPSQEDDKKEKKKGKKKAVKK